MCCLVLESVEAGFSAALSRHGAFMLRHVMF
jgi:hypothetical protein